MSSLKLTMWVCLLVSTAGIALGQTMQQQPSRPPQGLSSASESSAPVIEIGPGDILNIKVYGVPDLSGQFRVSQSGRIDMPLIRKVSVASLNADGAASLIAEKLKSGGFILHPQVTVEVAEFTTQGADVMGQVRRPGIYPTLGTRRLLDMLTLAGGATPAAGNLVTIIHRNDPHHPVYLALAQKPSGYKLQANPVILPGDTIVVQKSGIAYIMGAVGRPGGYLIDNNEPLTLMEAISLAGGTTITSRIKDVRIIRKVAAGKEVVKLNLKKIYLGRAPDITVRDGDIVFIPTSNIKAFFYQGLNGLTSLASTANAAVFASQY